MTTYMNLAPFHVMAIVGGMAELYTKEELFSAMPEYSKESIGESLDVMEEKGLLYMDREGKYKLSRNSSGITLYEIQKCFSDSNKDSPFETYLKSEGTNLQYFNITVLCESTSIIAAG